MIDDKFDSFLSNSLKAAEVEVDTPINGLERIIADRVTINKRMKKQKQLRFIQVAAVIILLIGISGAVLFPNPVSAIKKQLFQTIIDIGKSININLNSDAGKVDQDNQIIEQVWPVQQQTTFKILIPHYIPPGYSLESVKSNSTNDQTRIIMSFVGKKSAIVFSQTKDIIILV